MWKTVIRSLVVLMILLATNRATAAPGLRKLFVREISLKGSCVSEVSADSLRALIAQEVPREILKVRGLAYEDPTPYLDAGSWNAENFNARETRHIMQRLRQLDMQLMLWLEVSCVPGRPGEPIFVLTGRLLDLDRMDRILSCQDAQVRDQRRICHASGDVYEAVTFARVEMHSFAEFHERLRPLLARLLRVPELIFHDSPKTFAPGQMISLQFSMRSNDLAREAPAGATVPARQPPRYVQQVVRLPADQRDAVCQDPEQHWKQLPCGGAERVACRDPVRFQISELGNKPRPARKGEDGGPIISFHAPSHEDDFLVRAEVLTAEAGGEVRSVPVYRCLGVRERTWRLGTTLRWGEELAAWWASQIGLDLFLERAVIPRRGYPPLFGVAAVLGGTYIMHGTKDSIIMPNENQIQYKITSATSFAPEIRGQIFFDVLHLRQGFLRMYGDVGLGLEWTTIEQATTTIRVQPDESRSIGPLTEVSRYGPDGLLLGGIGLSLGGHFGLATGWDLGLALGVFYQYRGRFTGLQSDKRTDLVPQQQQVLCITLGIDLASPLR